MFQPSPIAAEVYRHPSQEAQRLLRRARWLTSPSEGRSPWIARVALQMLIAPMTQLTFVSFDLQAFLFLVFHRRLLAVLGHGIFMTTENLFLMAWLRELTIARTSFGTIDGALVYLLLLLAWYGAVAHAARLYGWFAVTVPVVSLLYVASEALSALCHRHDVSPGWGVVLSASLVALSHGAEHYMPPRTVDPWRWVRPRDYMLTPELSIATRLLRGLHIVFISVNGAVAESWASLRLMHYNWLFVMMRLGYAPERYAELRSWSERAWASGEPALDFVGTGGGTFLSPPDRPA